MQEHLEAAKFVAEITAPVTAPLIETWVRPKLQGLFKGSKQRKALLEFSFITRFDEYLRRSFERHSFLSTVVFQNQRQLLEDFYLPLTLEAVGKSLELVVDGYPDDLFSKSSRILLVDTAGMGKSTILRYIFLQCVKQNEGIPVFVELRNLSENRGVLDVIFEELTAIDGEVVDRDIILQFIRRGDFLFFFDGYDEISPQDRASVTRDLQTFVSKAGHNHFIISSRQEPALATFADFQQFTIRPLKIQQAFSLIRKYDRGGETAGRLIEKLKGDTLRNIHEFLRNPLLVSLLYKSFDYKPTIPLRKHIFYRQVYDALFESHDLAKGGAYVREKHSGLDIEDFHRVLRHLGYLTFTQGKLTYIKDELLSSIESAVRQCPGVEVRPGDFYKDLLSTVPLFVLDGSDVRWQHKSIQEYFAAQFICVDAKHSQELILQRMCVSRERQRYQNVMDLCYDVDYKTFRRTLLYPLAEEYLHFIANAESVGSGLGLNESDRNLRAQLLFERIYVLFPTSYVPYDQSNEFEVLRDYVRDQSLLEESGIISSTIIWPDGGALLVISKPSATLVDFLAQKQDPLSTPVSSALARKSSATAHATQPGMIVDGESPVIVSESTCVLDISASNFKKLNYLLMNAYSHRLGILDEQRCREMIADVDLERERELELKLLSELL